MSFDAESVRGQRERLLLRLLLRAGGVMNNTMTDRIRERGFADFQPSFTALLVHVDTEGTRVGTVASRLGTSRQAVSQLIRAIETLGYLERSADPGDARAVVVRHTERGRQLLVTAIEVMLGIEAEYEAILGADGFRRLKSLLKRLLEGAAVPAVLGRD